MYKYKRLLNNTLGRLLEPGTDKIIAILGSRQVGKTTLLEDFALVWKGKVVKYVGDKLEDAILWRGKFSDVKNNLELSLKIPLEELNEPALLIFDEIQKIPEAFNNLKILYDNYRDKIKIAISGSSSLSLLHRTSESLGGRVEIATMYPLSFTEILSDTPHSVWMKKSEVDFNFIKSEVLKKSEITKDAERYLDKALCFGFFPEAYLEDGVDEVKLLYQNYHQTYIEKDIRDLKQIGSVLDFDLVWKIAHRRSGQMLNYSNISKETGISFNTVKKYIAILKASFNIVLLHPFIHNIERRLVKSPKIFSQDLGFFNHCLGVYSREILIASSLIGRIFETLMIMEFFKQERTFIMDAEPYFFRTSAGAEVDLVVKKGLELFAYEFKWTEKVDASDSSGIRSLMSIAGKSLKAGFIVTRQPYAEQLGENLFAVPWWYFCV